MINSFVRLLWKSLLLQLNGSEWVSTHGPEFKCLPLANSVPVARRLVCDKCDHKLPMPSTERQRWQLPRFAYRRNLLWIVGNGPAMLALPSNLPVSAENQQLGLS